jgi:endonuclease YncB( thermonuclease family)
VRGLAAVLVMVALVAADEVGQARGAGTEATVQRVVDGDTLATSAGRVRLLAIDTPEVYGGVECGGREASRAMRRILHKGSRVRLVADAEQGDTDRYGRLLRYVMVRRHGTDDVGRLMVRRGWAEVYEAYPTSRTPSYEREEWRAVVAGRGIWGLCPEGGGTTDGRR